MEECAELHVLTVFSPLVAFSNFIWEHTERITHLNYSLDNLGDHLLKKLK